MPTSVLSFLPPTLTKRQVGNPATETSTPSESDSNSISQLLSTFVPVFIVFVISILAFLVLRRIFPRIYSPRTFVGSLRDEERSPRLSTGFLNWVGDFAKTPDTIILNRSSFDGYLFLRFLKISFVACFVGCLITWPILFPVNATGGAGNTGLNVLNISNVDPSAFSRSFRYVAHAGCAWIFFGFIIYTITRESIYYINLRQAYLLNPLYATRISSRTVLYAMVPPQYQSEEALRKVLGPGVRHVWLASDVSDLEDKVQERDDLAMKLEGAECRLIVDANKAHAKATKKGGGGHDDEETAIGASSGSVAARYIPQKKRPTHRLKPMIGRKVDTIDYARAELPKMIAEVQKLQAKHREDDCKLQSAAFVMFETVIDAQSAFQSLTHHQALHMAPRFIGMNPSEIIWSNLRIKWWERIVRNVVTTAIVTSVVIFWSIPVAAVGAISGLDALIGTPGFAWLGFLRALPDAIFGVVSGLLPTILLALLMALLPIFLRFMARMSGDPTLSAVELSVQNYYFAFQVVQVFLVTTLASGIVQAIQDIVAQPTNVLQILSTSLPKASNFFLAYFVLQGLAIAAATLLNYVGLLVFKILGKILDKTPRKMYKRWTNFASLGWGTVMPIYTNLFVIGICYAVIAPLVLGFACVGLFLFYVAYRYNLLYVYDTDVETTGLIYPRAMQQLFVGLYVAQGTLVGYFAFTTGAGIGAVVALAMMIVSLVFTALYHVSLNKALDPLLKYLPKTLEAEERSLLAAERGHVPEAYAGNGNHGQNGHEGAYQADSLPNKEATPAPHPKPNFFKKWLRPEIYTDYHTMRRLVPKNFEVITYDAQVERDAYFHPAITSETPLLWIPRDPLGVSRQEVRDTSRSVPITDEGAALDSKNRIIWDAEHGRPPIWEEKIYY